MRHFAYSILAHTRAFFVVEIKHFGKKSMGTVSLNCINTMSYPDMLNCVTSCLSQFCRYLMTIS